VSFFDPWVSELKTTDAWTLFPAASEADLPKASAALKEIAAASRFTDEQRHVLMEASAPWNGTVGFSAAECKDVSANENPGARMVNLAGEQ